MRRRRRSRVSLLLVVGLLLLGAAPAVAQSVSEGTITGTVYLPTGETQPGVTITVRSDALVSGERTATSGDGGRFVFLSLPPGEYILSVALAGFRPVTITGLLVGRGGGVDVPVRLEIGGLADEIVVTSETPLVDTRSSTIDTTFTQQLLDKVPTARSAFYDLALTAPGMGAVGADESWLPSPAAYGSATSQNVFLVNGVNTTNPRGSSWGSLVTVNYNTVEEVKILSLGTKAEYGSFSGAAIDVLTKSGGNEFHGDVAYYTMLGNASDNATLHFGKDWLYADPSDSLVTFPKRNNEISVTGGGPIVRDALWFYAGYSDLSTKTDTPLRPNDETWDAKLYDLKLTGDFSHNHRLWVGVHYEDLTSGYTTWGNTWDATMYYDQGQKNWTPQLQYQWVVSDRDLFSFKYLGYDTKQKPTIPATVGHPGYVNWWKWIGTQAIGVNGDFPFVEAQKSKRHTLQADFSHYADDFLGEHDMKFGVQYTRSEGNWEGGYFQGYANFAYPYPWDYGPAANWWWNCPYEWCWGTDENPVFPIYNRVVERNPWLTVRKSSSTGAFFDDTWVLNKDFTLNIGLRYDRMTAKYGEGAVYEMPTSPSDINNPTVLRKRAGTGNVFDFKTWSPRLGFAWQLTGDGKTVLRSHLGRYYAPMGVEAVRSFGPDMDPTVQNTWIYYLPMSEVDLNGNGMIDFDEVIPATRLLYGRQPNALLDSSISDPTWYLEVEPGTKSPYTDQFNISIQRQVASNLALEFSYIYKEEKNLLALRPYDRTTGEFFEWERLPFTTWTGYETYIWQIVMKDFNGDGVINGQDYAHVLNGDGLGYRVVNADSFAGQDVHRTYHGLQLVLNKRYADRWQAMAAVNYTKTNGFYPRTVDQNWYIDGPLVMDTPFGSTMNHYQNNLSGPALMTPKWMAKLAGSYTIPYIETDLGVRFRYDSGRAIFPIQSIGTYASWMGDTPQPGTYFSVGWGENMVASDPNHPDWMPSTSIFDFSLSRPFKFGEAGELRVSLDILNAFNENSPNRVGYAQGDYGRVYSLVLPRTVRLGLKYSL